MFTSIQKVLYYNIPGAPPNLTDDPMGRGKVS